MNHVPGAGSEALQTIHLATALIVNPHTQQALIVRKTTSLIFMQAGGKIEAGEVPFEALSRELAEEIGLTITADMAEYIGQFTAPAANEVGHSVVADVFYLEISETVEPQAEIAEVLWVDPLNLPDIPMAPLSRGQLMPLAANRIKARV